MPFLEPKSVLLITNKDQQNQDILLQSVFFFSHSEVKESCKREFITFTLGSLIITDAVNVGLKPICPQDGLPNPYLENFASHVHVQSKYNFNTKRSIIPFIFFSNRIIHDNLKCLQYTN